LASAEEVEFLYRDIGDYLPVDGLPAEYTLSWCSIPGTGGCWQG
jgi:hypothetical protein